MNTLDHRARRLRHRRRRGSPPTRIAVAHARGDGLLLLEGEAVAAPSGVVMQMIAHGPQKIGRALDLVGLARDEHAEAHEIAEDRHPPAGARRPQGDVEIAQPPAPFFTSGSSR